ncbi:hypothetical protein M0804_001718 [Polistes exclamans]|nr:hypothetical protein M0804_001718 [Polistes exclamans]
MLWHCDDPIEGIKRKFKDQKRKESSGGAGGGDGGGKRVYKTVESFPYERRSGVDWAQRDEEDEDEDDDDDDDDGVAGLARFVATENRIFDSSAERKNLKADFVIYHSV